MNNTDIDLKKDKYVNPECLIKVFEDMTTTKKGFEELKHLIEVSEVTITEDEIRNYLYEKLEKENPELKQRIEKKEKQNSEERKYSISDNFGSANIEDILNSSQDFADEIAIQRYCFAPYTLEYFKKYTKILKNKLFKLFNLIEKISVKNYAAVKKEIDSFDISINENGNILFNDIIRLVEPTLYNFDKLLAKLDETNNPETYLELKLTKLSLYRDGFSENEIYPSSLLQLNDLYDRKGYIALSPKQKEELEKQKDKNIEETAKFLVNLWD